MESRTFNIKSILDFIARCCFRRREGDRRKETKKEGRRGRKERGEGERRRQRRFW